MTTIPSMKLGLASYKDIIDIKKIKKLSGIKVTGKFITIGATTKHVEVANSKEIKKAIPSLAALAEGIGGISVFINGAVGGLMTTNPSHPIPDPFNSTLHEGATFKKTQAQGQQLGLLALRALRSKDAKEISKSKISLRAKTITIPSPNSFLPLSTNFLKSLGGKSCTF